MIQLTPLDTENYWSRGFAGPFPVLSAAECTSILDELRSRPEIEGLPGRSHLPMTPEESRHVNRVRINRHVDISALRRLALLPEILDRVEQVIGPNLMLWRSAVFARGTRPGTGAGWHRDTFSCAVIRGTPQTHIGIQVALTHSSGEQGIFFIPGTQRLTDAEITRKFGLHYLSGSREHAVGQATFYEPRPFTRRGLANQLLLTKARLEQALCRLPLKAGEMILINPGVLHCSGYGKSHAESPNLLRWAVTMRVAQTSQFVERKNYNDGDEGSRPLVLLRGSNLNPKNTVEVWDSG